MTEEPENLVLHLLREMREENRQMHGATQEQIAKVKMELYVEIAAVSADLKIVKTKVEQIDDRLETVEVRLNGVDRRLARIECHTGLMKA